MLVIVFSILPPGHQGTFKDLILARIVSHRIEMLEIVFSILPRGNDAPRFSGDQLPVKRALVRNFGTFNKLCAHARAAPAVSPFPPPPRCIWRCLLRALLLLALVALSSLAGLGFRVQGFHGHQRS